MFAGLFASQIHAAADFGVYELRIYTCNEGKLDALLARFRDHTCRLFEKHGITNLGYWVPMDEADGSKNTLIYLLGHASREAAKANWKTFAADPEWVRAKTASEAGGKILAKAPESIFMIRTDYSPPLALTSAGKPRTFELRTYSTPTGKLDALHARFREYTMQLFGKHGMTNVAYWVPVDASKGAGTKLIYLLAHASREAGRASFAAFRADPAWIKAKAESEAAGPLTLPGGVKSVYMQATDFSPMQ